MIRGSHLPGEWVTTAECATLLEVPEAVVANLVQLGVVQVMILRDFRSRVLVADVRGQLAARAALLLHTGASNE